MPRFAANLTMMFNEVEFTERFGAAARAGFRGVEYLFPYAYEAHRIAELLADNGSPRRSSICPPGTGARASAGSRACPTAPASSATGSARPPNTQRSSRCRQLNCLAGIAPAGLAEARAQETLVANVAFAATQLERHGIRLLIEPINTRDIPGFFLNRTAQALDIMKDRDREHGTAVRRLPHADHGGRPRLDHREEPRNDRSHSRSPTIPAGTSRGPARSTTRSCSATLIGSGMPAGSAANTSPPETPKRASPGSGRS